MKKSKVIISFIILISLISFISAGFITNFFVRITGNADITPTPLGIVTQATIGTDGWTNWLNRDTPGGIGDWETRTGFTGVCSSPLAVECRRIGTTNAFSDAEEAFWSNYQNIDINPNLGCVCNSTKNGNVCYDYQVRFLCCLDSDNENNLSVRGKCTNSTGTYFDVCYNSTAVYEKMCSGSLCANALNKPQNCPLNYLCQFTSDIGAYCILNCTDSDGGINYSIKGVTKLGTTSVTDSCDSTGKILTEYYCNLTTKSIQSKTYTCSKGCDTAKGACILNLSVSVATLKDYYLIGAQIKLTDPPEEDLNNQFINENIDETFQNWDITSSNYSNASNGYIIEFETPPTIVKKIELEEEAKENKKYIEEHSALDPTSLYKRVNSVLPKDVPAKIKEYSNNLDNEHKTLKNEILNTVTLNRIPNSITGGVVELNKELKVSREFKHSFNGVSLDISEEESKNIEKIPGVKAVYPNYEVHADLMNSVPLINADDVWKLDANGGNCATSGKECLTGKGITIAIIDTGVDYTHPDLGKGCFGVATCKVIGGYDFINEDNDPMDDQGHGTACAAIAAGNGVLKGVAPDAKIYAFKVLDANAGSSSDLIISGIERSIDLDNDGIIMENKNDYVNIISMSIGHDCNLYNEDCGPNDPMSKAVDNVVNAGVVVVIAAGNSGPQEETIGSPGTARKAITIGASDSSYGIAEFSARGPVAWTENGVEKYLIKPDIVAPGVNICTAQWNYSNPNSYMNHGAKICVDLKHVNLSGTSMAAPHVAGVAALLKQKHPDWTPENIKNALKSTSINLGKSILEQGNGRVDAYKSITLTEKPLTAEILTNEKFIGETLRYISGTASGEGFASYTLYYSTYITSSNWIEICSSTTQRTNSVLCIWNFGDLAEGNYFLKLDVRSINGNHYSTYGFVDISNTEITSPPDLMDYYGWYWDNPGSEIILRSDEPIEIYGTASGKNFQGYSLQWCNGYGSSGWGCSKEGLSYSGNQKVVKGLLGTWNPPANISTGFYYINLTNNYSGIAHYYAIKVHIETDLLKGWPKDANMEDISMTSTTKLYLYQPTIADIDGNGEDDLVMTEGASINVLDKYGNSLPGWPVRNIRNPDFGGVTLNYGPAVGDINNDGQNEIVSGDSFGGIHIFKKDGTYLISPKTFEGIIRIITLADINKDGYLEIIWSNGKVHVVDRNLNYLTGFPKSLPILQGYQIYLGSQGAVAVADLNNDGNTELVVETTSCNPPTGCVCASPWEGSQIWVLNNKGNVLNGWPKQVNALSYSNNIVLADINEDKNKEIIFGTHNGTVFALNYTGGNITSWPISIYNLPKGQELLAEYVEVYGVVVGDINLDGKIEVVFTGNSFNSYSQGLVNCLFVYDNQGKPLKGFPVCGDGYRFLTEFYEIPTIANLDDDPEMEIFAQGNSGGGGVNNLALFYLINHDGRTVNDFTKFIDDNVFGNLGPIGDLNNDGYNELFIRTWRGTTLVYKSDGKSINDEWPVFQHDAQHTGDYHFSTGEKRPQSKIVNSEDFAVTGNLLMRLQLKSGANWLNVTTVTNQTVTIPAKGLIKLDVGGNYGWDLKNVKVNTVAGRYRIYVLFTVGEQKIEKTWEFTVTPLISQL